MKADIILEVGKFVLDIATSKQKEDIKELVDRAMQVCPFSSSSSEGKIGALATKADFMALGDQYLTNLNYVSYELIIEGNKLRADILQKVAIMKWQTNLHLNKTELKVGSLVEKLGDATTQWLRKLKRKALRVCKKEVGKKRKDDEGHDDQGPSHHE